MPFPVRRVIPLCLLAAALFAADQAPPTSPPPTAPPAAPPAAPSASDFGRDIGPVIKNHCHKCHTGDEPEGEFSLYFEKEQDLLDRANSDRMLFEKMVENLRDRKMPPDDAPQPTDADRARLIEWVERKVLSASQPKTR